MTLETELLDIQTRIAYQEDLLMELNTIVARQDAEILTLRQEVRRLSQRIKEILTNPVQGSINDDERPPHY